MKAYDVMLARAYCDFDEMVERSNQQQRRNLKRAGWANEDIDKAISRATSAIQYRRERLPAEVAIAFLNSNQKGAAL